MEGSAAAVVAQFARRTIGQAADEDRTHHANARHPAWPPANLLAPDLGRHAVVLPGI
ncbi:MAG TPA: hypothetical protein VKD91_05570 [Pyrinomonadaceae bacterium]|nr:hypothetical protein [Pyrinomonadaceae bacterium]